ncbi:MAG: hypothetical protein PHX87_05220 [Candidatus Peribacteraceae bacterium]|nr:hypothetical protein [Candidatus Peribacteraceae bacterium]MDD5742796.1 hypothetical protein [Candidatus Peribacteraceae bacterium]
MSAFLHRLSAILFYLLAGSFFVSYLLLRNGIGLAWPQWWMNIADLPLALVAALYGGSSLYRSVKRTEGVSKPLLIVISIPLLAFFTLLIVLNFWNVLGLPQGPAL